MGINFWAVLVCAVVSMIIGSLWYGPIFGRKWMQIIGMKPEDCAGDQMKGMWKLYLTQFILSLVQAGGLAWLIIWSATPTLYCVALTIWISFTIPLIAGNIMWGGKSGKLAWQEFFIQIGYNLIIAVVFTFILTSWR